MRDQRKAQVRRVGGPLDRAREPSATGNIIGAPCNIVGAACTLIQGSTFKVACNILPGSMQHARQDARCEEARTIILDGMQPRAMERCNA